MKITKGRLKQIINEELNEMLSDDPSAPVHKQSTAESYYEYSKSMAYTKIRNALDQLIKDSKGQFDEKMKMRILRGMAKVLGDRAMSETISKEDDDYVVRSKSGKKLGSHDTKKEANAQLAAVEISKKKRGK
tara:strand:+ start:923 stop:1318 length:396 start_codon:yes stop_codon:yes gene_type:complete